MKHIQLENPDRLAESSASGRNRARERIELLRSRAWLLEGKDKVLIQMYLENGASFRQMAAIAEVNEVTIARRIHKLVKRLVDGGYITCLRNREQLSRVELEVARDYLLAGLSQRSIAAKRMCSVYRVRMILKKIEQLVRAADRGQDLEKCGGNVSHAGE